MKRTRSGSTRGRPCRSDRARRRGRDRCRRFSAAASWASPRRCCCRRRASRVVLVEAERLGHGVTGHTTAKVTSQHGLKYASLRSNFGAEARAHLRRRPTRRPWSGSRSGSSTTASNATSGAAPAYTYVPSGEATEARGRGQAAAAAGLPARRWTTRRRCPTRWPPRSASTTRRSSTFAGTWWRWSSSSSPPAGEVFERSRAIQVDAGEPCLVGMPGGMVKAGSVVVATHYPFLDRSLAFARVHPQRSYALALPGRRQPPPAGMFLSAESPTRSIRAVPVGGEELLLVGGEGHKTGTGRRHRGALRRPRGVRREHWDVESVEYQWSSQDNRRIDGLPLHRQGDARSSPPADGHRASPSGA